MIQIVTKDLYYLDTKIYNYNKHFWNNAFPKFPKHIAVGLHFKEHLFCFL